MIKVVVAESEVRAMAYVRRLGLDLRTTHLVYSVESAYDAVRGKMYDDEEVAWVWAGDKDLPKDHELIYEVVASRTRGWDGLTPEPLGERHPPNRHFSDAWPTPHGNAGPVPRPPKPRWRDVLLDRVAR